MTTIKTLEYLCSRINTLTGSPMEPYTKHLGTGDCITNVGCYHLSGAYGGYCVHRMHNEGGGVTAPIFSGYRPKAEVEQIMRAFIRGIEIGIEVAAHDLDYDRPSMRYVPEELPPERWAASDPDREIINTP